MGANLTSLTVDFSGYERDLFSEGLGRLLSVFLNKCTVREFAATFLRQVQELYDAAIDVEKARTVVTASGVNLDALGRIVGQPRTTIDYSEDVWFKFDTSGQGFDQLPWWVTGAPLNTNATATDSQFRQQIIARIIKNHTLCASIPELLYLIRTMFDVDVSFIKKGPNEVQFVVQDGTDKVLLYNLLHRENTMTVDDDYRMPYPATLSLDSKVFFIKEPAFIFDVDTPHRWDEGMWGITA